MIWPLRCATRAYRHQITWYVLGSPYLSALLYITRILLLYSCACPTYAPEYLYITCTPSNCLSEPRVT